MKLKKALFLLNIFILFNIWSKDNSDWSCEQIRNHLELLKNQKITMQEQGADQIILINLKHLIADLHQALLNKKCEE